MKIFHKLILTFGGIALMAGCVGIIVWLGMSNIENQLRHIGEHSMPQVEGLGLAMEGMISVKTAERTMINPAISEEQREAAINNLSEFFGTFQEGWDQYCKTIPEKSRSSLDEAKAAIAKWQEENRRLTALVKTAQASGGNNSAAMAQASTIVFGSGRLAFNAAMEALNGLYENARADAEESRQLAFKTTARSKLLAVLAVLFGGGFAMGAGIVISHKLTQPIQKMIGVLKQLAAGDTSAVDNISLGKEVNCSSIKNCGKLDCPSFGKKDHCWVKSGSLAVFKHCRENSDKDCHTCELYGAKSEIDELASYLTSLSDNLRERQRLAMEIASGDFTHHIELGSEKDELGMALRTMQDRLSATINQTKLAGEEIANGAIQIADSSQSLAQGASTQASSLEEISSAMTQISSQTKMTADHANQAQELSNSARTAAEEGNQQMQQMVAAMEEIRVASQSVANVIKVIEEIAFQTNMLALNAAVEAAHAGQHGKGFAVVAEEVRNLAARSAKAARETADLIAGSVSKTENGTKIADQTAVALAEIMTRITRASELVKGIAEAAREQSQGIDQVSQGLHQIDQVTQQNSANAEQGAAASEELSGQAAQLNQLMQAFKLAASGHNGPPQLGR
ncbi:MAG: HAMP domain-containing protein [Desulfobulbaceae bacterium]|nr:HAMP domain-containing protein [Desulfobulbaceae bacterium]